MGAFLEMLGNFITSLVNFVYNIINGVIQMLTMIPISVGFLSNTLAYIPAVLSVVITAVVTVNVVYLIIGR